MLNLIIDIGNTLTKFAIYNHGDLMLKVSEPELTKDHVCLLKQEYAAIENVIVSSVRKDNTQIIEWLNECFKFVMELDWQTATPINNQYETPETLGLDRFAAAVGAANIFPETNVLIIDAGTAITYDILDKDRNYIGGSISAGIGLRFKALHESTGKLPLLSPNASAPIVAQNTNDAITSGVFHGIKGELNQFVEHYSNNYDNLHCILTGGDMKYISTLLDIPHQNNADITLNGLNLILDHHLNLLK